MSKKINLEEEIKEANSLLILYNRFKFDLSWLDGWFDQELGQRSQNLKELLNSKKRPTRLIRLGMDLASLNSDFAQYHQANQDSGKCHRRLRDEHDLLTLCAPTPSTRYRYNNLAHNWYRLAKTEKDKSKKRTYILKSKKVAEEGLTILPGDSWLWVASARASFQMALMGKNPAVKIHHFKKAKQAYLKSKQHGNYSQQNYSKLGEVSLEIHKTKQGQFSSGIEAIINYEIANLVSGGKQPGHNERLGNLFLEFGKKIQHKTPEELGALRQEVQNVDLSQFEQDPNYEKIKPGPLLDPNNYFIENKNYFLYILFGKAHKDFTKANRSLKSPHLKEKIGKCLIERGKAATALVNLADPNKLFRQAARIFSELEEKLEPAEFYDLSRYQFLHGEAQLRRADLHDKDLRGYLNALSSFQNALNSYEQFLNHDPPGKKDKDKLRRCYAKIGWTYFKIGQKISGIKSIKNPLHNLLQDRLKTNLHSPFNFALHCYNTAGTFLKKARQYGDTAVESKSKSGSCYFALAKLKFKRWQFLQDRKIPLNILKNIPHPPKQLEKEINQDLNHALDWYNLTSKQDPDFLIPLYFKCLIASEFKDAPFNLENKLFQNPDQPWEEFYDLIMDTPRHLKWEMTRSQVGVVVDKHGLIRESMALKRSNNLERIVFEKLHQYNEKKKSDLKLRGEFLQLPEIIHSLPRLNIMALPHGQQTLYEKAKILAQSLKITANNIKKTKAQGEDPEKYEKRRTELRRERTEIYKPAIQQLIRIDMALHELRPEIREQLIREAPEEPREIECLKEKQDYIQRFKKVVINNQPFQYRTTNERDLENIMSKFSGQIAKMPHFIYSDCNPCNFSQFIIDKENIKEMAYLFDAAILLYHEGPDFNLKDIRKLFRYVITEREKAVNPQTSYQTISKNKRKRYHRDFDYISVFRLFTLIGNEQEKLNQRLSEIEEPKKTYWKNLLTQRQHLYLNYIKEIAHSAARSKYHTKKTRAHFKELYQTVKDMEIARPIQRPSQSKPQAAS
ncbi:MAG: hypothetical protein KAT77_04720 [Nanoarchaeota archaeon]|nr:hypothetical protein [Nanoarchaeota archaeon]